VLRAAGQLEGDRNRAPHRGPPPAGWGDELAGKRLQTAHFLDCESAISTAQRFGEPPPGLFESDTAVEGVGSGPAFGGGEEQEAASERARAARLPTRAPRRLHADGDVRRRQSRSASRRSCRRRASRSYVRRLSQSRRPLGQPRRSGLPRSTPGARDGDRSRRRWSDIRVAREGERALPHLSPLPRGSQYPGPTSLDR
jgi:hypothetical protein